MTPRRPRAALLSLARLPARARHGRPAILALRTIAALTAAGTATRSGAGPAALAGTLAGIAAGYLLTARADLAPPPERTP